MYELKRLSREGIEAALQKAERYRLLNEPREAESICLDILEIDSRNQKALVVLLLARTDQFLREVGARLREAREVLPRLEGEYEKAYYAGVVCERWAKAQLSRSYPGSGSDIFSGLRDAMDFYEKAEKIRPPGNDDALLRWNACARLIAQHKLRPAVEEFYEPPLE